MLPCPLLTGPVRFRVSPLTILVPWSNGNDAWFTSRKRWFDSIRDYSSRSEMPTAAAQWLSPAESRNRSRWVPDDVLSSWSSGVLACLSRRRSWVQIPSGTLTWPVRLAARMRDPHSRGMGSIPIRVTDIAKWRNQQTRDAQNVVPGTDRRLVGGGSASLPLAT